MKTTQYDEQAATFLAKHGLKVRITLSDTKAASWEPSGHHYRVSIWRGPAHPNNARLVFDFWGSVADAQCKGCNGKKTVRLAKPELIHVPNPEAETPVFVGYGARNEEGKYRKLYELRNPKTITQWKREGECPECKGTGMAKNPIAPSEYDILACISSDAYCPETFEDFCGEYGYEADSIKALQTFRRADRFAKRLRAFFTEAELSELSEIQ